MKTLFKARHSDRSERSERSGGISSLTHLLFTSAEGGQQVPPRARFAGLVGMTVLLAALLFGVAGCEKKEEGQKSADCEIVAFVVNGVPWNINGATIAHTYPEGTQASMLTPTITVSAGAKVTPASGSAQNLFTAAGVAYTVTAEDGTTTKTYTAKATITATPDTPGAACDIVGFTVNGVAWDISGTTITYTYPEGTQASTLTPAISVSAGATVTPASGVAQNFFTDAGVTYTVTAANGTTQKTYTAKATTGANIPGAACDIVGFTVNGVAWDIAAGSITHSYSPEAAFASLTPDITVSAGAMVTPASGVAQNFFTTQGVTYTVTAANGTTTKTYIAKATTGANIPDGICDIEGFTVDGVAWDIAAGSITHSCSPEAALASLTPDITVSAGATVTPASGVAQNFFTTQGVTYTVTAANGVITKTYIAKATVQAVASGATGDCIWILTGTDGNYTLTITGNGAMGDYSSSSNPPWYVYRSGIRTVVIQNGVTTIGEHAFYDCDGLTGALTIPNSVTTIGERAFEGCTGLTGALTIGNSVTTIGESAFYQCYDLTGVTIGNSVETIGEYAFYGCTGLTEVTIPNSVTTIGEYAFGSCYGLTAINVDAGNMYYSADGGVLLDKSKTTLILCPQAKTGSYTIPNSVTTIGYWAFHECIGLTSVTIGNSVETISGSAFYECRGLTGALTIPNSVTTIGNSAFYGCTGLTSVTIGNSVTTIGNFAFYRCIGLTGALTIPNSVTTIGGMAFYDCIGLTGALTIGNSVTTIGNFAFYRCIGLTGALTIPNSVTTIGGMAFYNCIGLTGALTIGNSVTTIGAAAFYDCIGLTGALTIGNSVTTIGAAAFLGCDGLTGALTIPNSVTTIGERAFIYCSGFTGVTIGSSVTTIGSEAFRGCSKLTEVINQRTTPQSINSDTFSTQTLNGTLKVPAGAKEAYKAAAVWKDFKTIESY